MIPGPKSSDVLDFCCGKRKCPILRRDPESVVIADPDQTTGEIRLTRDQIADIVPWLEEWLGK